MHKILKENVQNFPACLCALRVPVYENFADFRHLDEFIGTARGKVIFVRFISIFDA